MQSRTFEETTMTISKQDLLGQLPLADTKSREMFDAVLAEDDDILSFLWNGLIAYYKAQIETNKTLPQGENVQSVTAPSAQQQSDGKGGFYMVKSVTIRVKSPISDEILPIFS